MGDGILIAPATANTLARLSSGRGDDLLSTITLAFEGPISLAPAMNQAMWRDSRTRENLKKLIDKGYIFSAPVLESKPVGCRTWKDVRAFRNNGNIF